MKSVLLFGFFLITKLVIGQEAKENQEVISNADAFSTQAGTLIEKQFLYVGAVKGVEVEVVKTKDLISGKAISSLRLQYEFKLTHTSTTKIASLDSDEIDGLIKSLHALQTNVFPTSRDNYTEVTFRSRTGFLAGAFYDFDKKAWTPYLEFSRFSKSSVFMTVADFDILLEFLEEAKKKL